VKSIDLLQLKELCYIS